MSKMSDMVMTIEELRSAATAINAAASWLAEQFSSYEPSSELTCVTVSRSAVKAVPSPISVTNDDADFLSEEMEVKNMTNILLDILLGLFSDLCVKLLITIIQSVYNARKSAKRDVKHEARNKENHEKLMRDFK